MKKTLALIIVVFLFLSAFLILPQTVKAEITVVTSYYDAVYDQNTIYAGQMNMSGQTFQGNGKYITDASFILWLIGDSALIRCGLYSVTANHANVLLETSSTTYNSSTQFTGSGAYYNFSFAGTTQLQNGVSYAIAVYNYQGGATPGIRQAIDVDGASYATGNMFDYKVGTGWEVYDSGGTNFDVIFIIYGSDTYLAPTPTPTATPTPTPTPTPSPPPSWSISSQYNIADDATGQAVPGVINSTIGWYTDYNVTQGAHYTFVANILNNSVAMGVSGTWNAYITDLYNGTANTIPGTNTVPISYSEAYTDLNGEAFTQTLTGSIVNGFVIFDIDPVYVYGSTKTHQGFLVNFTVTGYTGDIYEGLLQHHFILTASDQAATPTPTPTATLTPGQPTPTPSGFLNFDWTGFGSFLTNIYTFLMVIIGIVLTFLGILLLMRFPGGWVVGLILFVAGFFIQILASPNIFVLFMFAVESLISSVFLYNHSGTRRK